MKEMTCIVCPIGCALTIEETDDDKITVKGNRCPRGEAYALEELRSPKRMVTATCRLRIKTAASSNAIGVQQAVSREYRRVPVRTVLACPKEMVQDLLTDLYSLDVSLPIKHGDCIIRNWKGTGIDIIATRSLSG